MSFLRNQHHFMLVLLCAGQFAATHAFAGQGDAFSALPTQDSYFSSTNERMVLTRAFPREGVLVGQGWDLFLNRKTLGFCVAGKVAENNSPSSTISFSKINDHEQLYDALNIDASASYSGYGASVSAKVSFARSLTVDSDALNILAKVNLDRKIKMMIPEVEEEKLLRPGQLTLTPEAKALLQLDSTAAAKAGKSKDEQQREAYQRFRLRCGDAFIIGVREGGELDAYLSFKMTDRDAKQKLEASISGGGFGASVSSSVKAIHNDKTDHSSLDYHWYQSGDTPGTPNPVSVDQFVDNFAKFGTNQGFESVSYEAYLLTYSQLESAVNTDQFLPTNSYLNLLANHYWRLIDLLSQYNDVVLHPDNYYSSVIASDWKPIYEIQSDILQSAQFLDTQLSVCFSKRQCGEANNTSAAKKILQRALSPAAFTQAIMGSATTFGASSNNAFASVVSNSMSQATHPQVQSSPQIQSSPQPHAALPSFCINFCLYYYWLASKPVSKTDLANLWLLDYDETQKPRAGIATGVGHPTGDELKAHATSEMRNWLLRNRLLPISDSFCRISSKHPLCMDAGQLAAVVNAVNFNFDAGALKPSAPPPPPPQTPHIPPPHFPPPWHHCGDLVFC